MVNITKPPVGKFWDGWYSKTTSNFWQAQAVSHSKHRLWFVITLGCDNFPILSFEFSFVPLHFPSLPFRPDPRWNLSTTTAMFTSPSTLDLEASSLGPPLTEAFDEIGQHHGRTAGLHHWPKPSTNRADIMTNPAATPSTKEDVVDLHQGLHRSSSPVQWASASYQPSHLCIF